MTAECESNRSAKMIGVSLLVLVLPLLVLGCRRRSSMTQRYSYGSSSGNYQVIVTTNRDKTDETKYLCLQLHLADAGGRELHVLQTGASNTMKWALGWMPEKDVVVLYSSDIGTTAYELTPEGRLRQVNATDQIVVRGKQLNGQKYGER